MKYKNKILLIFLLSLLLTPFIWIGILVITNLVHSNIAENMLKNPLLIIVWIISVFPLLTFLYTKGRIVEKTINSNEKDLDKARKINSSITKIYLLFFALYFLIIPISGMIGVNTSSIILVNAYIVALPVFSLCALIGLFFLMSHCSKALKLLGFSPKYKGLGLRTKLSFLSIITSLIPFVIVALFSFVIAKNGVNDAGIGQIRDALKGGYSLVEYYYKRVEEGEITKTKAIEQIRRFLSGPIKDFWFKVKNKNDFLQFMKMFNIEIEEQIEVMDDSITAGSNIVAVFNHSKKVFSIADNKILKNMIKNYNLLSIEDQRKIVNSNFKTRVMRDLAKGSISIRKSGYVWAISGNLKEEHVGFAYEIFHPSISNLNVWKAKNYLGERVGQKISLLNGKLKQNLDGKIIRYDYLWKNPNDPSARKKIVLMKYFKPWNWVVCAGLYEDEFFVKILKIKNIMLLGLVIVVLLSICGVSVSMFMISKPIKSIKMNLIDLSSGEGDLSKRMPIPSNDEIGELTYSFNNFLDQLNHLTIKLKGSTNEVKENTDILSNSIKESTTIFKDMVTSIEDIHQNVRKQGGVIDQTTNTTNKIISSINSLSKNIESQSISVEQSSAAIEQLIANINSVSQTSHKANEIASNLSSVAKDGGDAIRNAIDAINEIENSSKQISEIVKIITGIAEQTNLLAMNAAIEAAHAGQYGKGFAVVADEIRKLSVSSTNSTKEISVLIKDITSKINRTGELTITAVTGLDGILSDIEQTKNIITEISGAMQEQSLGSKEILSSVSSLVSVTDEIKRTINEQKMGNEEIASVINNLEYISGKISDALNLNTEKNQQITGIIGEINEIVDNNENVVNRLEQIVSMFKVQEKNKNTDVTGISVN